jgi:hypothetical protein
VKKRIAFVAFQICGLELWGLDRDGKLWRTVVADPADPFGRRSNAGPERMAAGWTPYNGPELDQ